MSIRRWAFIFLGIITLAAPALSFAQSERGTVTGVVKDSTNAVVPGVAVTVLNIETNAATNVTTSDCGTYSAVNLPPGTYRVQASLEGFQTSIAEGVIVTPGGAARVDLTLSAGGVTSEIKVTADATPLHSEDARAVTAVSNKLIDELPLVVGGAMRSPFDLISTVPEARGSGGTVSLGGGQGGAFGATLDGVSVNTNRNADTVGNGVPDALPGSHHRVLGRDQRLQAGVRPGRRRRDHVRLEVGHERPARLGLRVPPQRRARHARILRADQGHLQAERLRRLARRPGAHSAPLRRHEPHVLLHVLRGLPQPAGQQLRVPQRADARDVGRRLLQLGQSQGQRLIIYDPATTRPNPNGTGFIRDPFPNNKIPVERFSTVAKQYIALARSVLVPNRPGLVPGTLGYVNNNYVSEGRSTVETTNKFSLKIDHTLSSRHRLAYVFNRTKNSLVPGPDGATGLPMPFGDFQQSTFDGDLHRASWDAVGSRLVNHFSIGANTFNKNAFSPNVDQGWKSKVCIPNAVDCDQNMGIISFSDLSTWGASSYNGTEQPRLTIKNDLTFLAGSHTLKGGFLFDRQQANGFGQQDYGGRAGFDFKHTGVPGVTTTTSGSAFASFLLGYADSGRTETIRYLQQIYPYYGFYAQDDWRVNGKLVVNYGVRYELHASAESRWRSVFGLLSDRTEPVGERLSGRADLCR